LHNPSQENIKDETETPEAEMSDISNGKGGIVSVTETPEVIALVPAAGVAGSHRHASILKVWNTGDYTLYATVNDASSTFTLADAIPIPTGEGGYFEFRKPVIFNLVLACAEGEATVANWGAC
jgi:hypothetical protein